MTRRRAPGALIGAAALPTATAVGLVSCSPKKLGDVRRPDPVVAAASQPQATTTSQTPDPPRLPSASATTVDAPRPAYVQPTEERTPEMKRPSSPPATTPPSRPPTTQRPTTRPAPRPTTVQPAQPAPSPTSAAPRGNTLTVGTWTHGYVTAYGSQRALDRCDVVEWEPLWFAGHNYCGYQFWAYLTKGQKITLTGRNAGTYVVTALVYLPYQGGKKPALPAY